MAQITTGLIENTKVSGVRPSSTFSVRISNADSVTANIRINGFYWNGITKTEYVLDLLTLAPGEAADRNYYAQFDAFEFRFVTSTDAVEISTRGKDAAGNMTVVHSMLPAELFSTGMEGIAGAPGRVIPSALNQIYVLNSSSNNISVIDGKANTFIGNVIVGSGPFGVGVNPITNRIYVVNFGSNNVSVIDGNSNTVITTITVGTNPVGVGVNPETNRIYVTNWSGHNVSVIDGFTHVVIATISVGASPEGVNVNPSSNRIYITNHGSKTVSVINGSTNAVIATVDVGN
ncbi:YncE family protein [Desulfosporosinus sp. BICA1-9]|uniref:YncE family protein n=1 Tax=Desulfosporosinus sp. BICA1-9 TaxID=1531958 RepID=UPI00054BCD5E|nr:YncE family protein [Desulfosporosinus sp. BICA1-9]KJS89869.1 MAG: YVTN family beta-propeller repeat protein [Desulfosporosinus sp. BICA1-9]HBW34992.1 YncE family protein [Desulfosporosinus sp.]